jgi:hypothetical protein
LQKIANQANQMLSYRKPKLLHVGSAYDYKKKQTTGNDMLARRSREKTQAISGKDTA